MHNNMAYCVVHYHVRQKELHCFIFAIALSKLHLLPYNNFLEHVYFSKFPIIRIFQILYIFRDKEPA